MNNEELDQKVTYWHEHPELNMPLHEYLNMTLDEYRNWVNNRFNDGAKL